MKKGVIFLILLIIFSNIIYAEEVMIPETFTAETSFDETTTYYYAGDKLLASESNNIITYHYQDRLGSDVNSKSLPFGQEIVNSERFSFTGKELDDELYYFNARYYDSNLGRFTSVDPVLDNHPYSYVENNPMNYVDITGMDGRNIELGPMGTQFSPALSDNSMIETPTIPYIFKDSIQFGYGDNQKIKKALYIRAHESTNGGAFNLQEDLKVLSDSYYYGDIVTVENKQEFFDAIHYSNNLDLLVVAAHGGLYTKPGIGFKGDDEGFILLNIGEHGEFLKAGEVTNEDFSSSFNSGSKIICMSCYGLAFFEPDSFGMALLRSTGASSVESLYAGAPSWLGREYNGGEVVLESERSYKRYPIIPFTGLNMFGEFDTKQFDHARIWKWIDNVQRRYPNDPY